MDFERLNVFVGSERIGGEPKGSASLAPVLKAARKAIAPPEQTVPATKVRH
jgi:hypothetical protein